MGRYGADLTFLRPFFTFRYPLGSPTCWNASNINCTAPRVNGYVDRQCSYGCVQNAGHEIKDMANYPNMRLYQNSGWEHGSKTPMAESSNSGWLTSDKFNGGFSAMCWFFGRDLYTSLSASGKMRPIGLIETNVGGTPDQHWSSPNALDACKNLPGNPKWQWPSNFTDSVLWNGKVVPLLRNTIKGVVWMQGESNSAIDGRQYVPTLCGPPLLCNKGEYSDVVCLGSRTGSPRRDGCDRRNPAIMRLQSQENNLTLSPHCWYF